MKFLIYFIFLSILSIQLKAKQKTSSNLNPYAVEALKTFSKILIEYSNPYISLFQILFNNNCSESLINVLNGTTSVNQLFIDSGKLMNDIGLKDGCQSQNGTYLLIKGTFSPSFLNDSSYSSIFEFNNQSTFFFGICLIKGCEDFYNDFLNPSINKVLFNKLNKTGINSLSISYITPYDNSNFNNNNDNKGEISTTNINENNMMMIILTYAIGGYLALKLLLSVISSCFTSSTLTEKTQEPTFDKTANQTFSFCPVTDNILPNPSVESKIVKDKSNYRMKFLNIANFFSFQNDFEVLITVKNEYFDDTNISFLQGVKSLMMFFIVFNRNFFILSIIPNRFSGNILFYKSMLFSVIKYSTLTIDCLVVTDAFIFAFKLKSYIKKHHIQGQKSLKLYALFQLNSLSRIITLYFIFIYFYYLIYSIIYFIHGEDNYFKTILDFDFSLKNCYQNFFYAFFPILPYFNGKYPVNCTSCFIFVTLFWNEFICSNLMILISMLSIHFKSKKFDDWVIGIIMLSSVLGLLQYIEFFSTDQKYNLLALMGDTNSINYPHMMICYYFIGYLCGTVYFYYIDLISDVPMSETHEYSSFSSCLNLMKIIDQMKGKTKILIQVILISIQILLCFSFTIIQNVNISSDDLDLEFTPFKKAVFVLEKKIFVVCFTSVITLSIISNKKTTILEFLLSNKISIFISRISFCMICLIDTVIYIFDDITDIEIYFNYSNMVFFALGVFIMNAILSLVIMLLIELPIRKYVKMIYRKYL